MPAERLAIEGLYGRIQMSVTVAEQFIGILIAAGFKRAYGVVGDSLNGLTDAIRRSGKVEWIHVHHEKIAAFVAGHFTGDVMSVCSSFSVLSGVALCAGYALLGAGWTVKKCEGDARDAAWRVIPSMLVAVLVSMAVSFARALFANLAVMHRWTERSVLFAVPFAGPCAIVSIWKSVRWRQDGLPFAAIVVLFVCAYAMPAISFWPYVIPLSLTIADAAAPHASLAFMFWGAGLFVYLLMLIYTVCSYIVFRGKVATTSDHY
jgi:cytochrome bd ubiquinol oxidase subunit II